MKIIIFHHITLTQKPLPLIKPPIDLFPPPPNSKLYCNQSKASTRPPPPSRKPLQPPMKQVGMLSNDQTRIPSLRTPPQRQGHSLLVAGKPQIAQKPFAGKPQIPPKPFKRAARWPPHNHPPGMGQTFGEKPIVSQQS